VPELFVKLFGLAEAGRWDDARAVQREINELIALVARFPLFPALKQILAWSGLDCGACLPPRTPLADPERRELREALARSGFERLAGRV
jgi:dihydrodipicolinate synthase/N-acetylneuraminate lyase